MINAFRTPADRRWYRLVLVLLILAAWATLVLWGASPYAGLLDHSRLGETGLSPLPALAIFVLGWTLMTVAMMLPSSLPMVNLFRRFTLHRADRVRLLWLLGIGYILVWAEFGVLAYLGDSVVHAAILRLPDPRVAETGLAASILLIAGAYQFTPLKTMCLEKCRSPYSFLVQYWSGRHASRDALRLGIRHGLFCVGCCWSLMLIMFAVGGANLGWMLVLGVFMAAERATKWGRRLTRPVGGLLVAWGALVLLGVLPFAIL